VTISSIGNSSSLSAAHALAGRSGPPGGGRGGGAIDVAAKALGLSSDEVINQLKDGKSLGDLADEQGVSRDDLTAALKAGAPPGMAEADDVDAVISAMIDRVGMPTGGPQGSRPGPPPGGMSGLSSIDTSTSGVLGSSLTNDQQAMLDQLSSVLGTDSNRLLDDLKSGSSLADLLSAQGVDQNTLASILQDGLLFDAKA
jgi:lambda repressor-like predicted transcriptional regulator